MDLENLVELAKKARENSYCPYTKFATGVALLCKNGNVYTGCNIENGGIQSLCSERTTFIKALSEGERDFNCMVLIGGPKDGDLVFTTPCGYCRQFISEFVDKDFKVHCFYDTLENIKTYTIKELLPESFKFEQ